MRSLGGCRRGQVSRQCSVNSGVCSTPCTSRRPISSSSSSFCRSTLRLASSYARQAAPRASLPDCAGQITDAFESCVGRRVGLSRARRVWSLTSVVGRHPRRGETGCARSTLGQPRFARVSPRHRPGRARRGSRRGSHAGIARRPGDRRARGDPCGHACGGTTARDSLRYRRDRDGGVGSVGGGVGSVGGGGARRRGRPVITLLAGSPPRQRRLPTAGSEGAARPSSSVRPWRRRWPA